MKLYIFRTVPLSITRSLFTVHSAMVRAGPFLSCSKAIYKPVWHIPLLSVQWINSWWWTEQLSETCRVSWQNRFVKLVHLVGFITKKFVTMHGNMNVKFCTTWFAETNDFRHSEIVSGFCEHVNKTMGYIKGKNIFAIRITDLLKKTVYQTSISHNEGNSTRWSTTKPPHATNGRPQRRRIVNVLESFKDLTE